MLRIRHFLFKVGPLLTGEVTTNAYFVYPGTPNYQTFFGRDDRAGLLQIAGHYSHDEIVCEPQLSVACREFGFMSEDFNPERSRKLSLIAFDLALPGQLQNIKNEELVYQFGMACAKFYSVAPWRFAYASRPVNVAITGSIKRRLQAVILGAGRKAYGLATYAEDVNSQNLVQLYFDGGLEKTLTLDTLGVTLTDSSHFIADAMDRAFGLRKLPIPVKLSKGERVMLRDEDMLTITVTLLSVSELSDQRSETNSSIRVPDLDAFAIAWT